MNDVHRNADVNSWRSFVFETSKNANGPNRQIKQSITLHDQKSQRKHFAREKIKDTASLDAGKLTGLSNL